MIQPYTTELSRLLYLNIKLKKFWNTAKRQNIEDEIWMERAASFPVEGFDIGGATWVR
jgi:hypothetical protein